MRVLAPCLELICGMVFDSSENEVASEKFDKAYRIMQVGPEDMRN